MKPENYVQASNVMSLPHFSLITITLSTIVTLAVCFIIAWKYCQHEERSWKLEMGTATPLKSFSMRSTPNCASNTLHVINNHRKLSL